jgi:hypothetical protein
LLPIVNSSSSTSISVVALSASPHRIDFEGPSSVSGIPERENEIRRTPASSVAIDPDVLRSGGGSVMCSRTLRFSTVCEEIRSRSPIVQAILILEHLYQSGFSNLVHEIPSCAARPLTRFEVAAVIGCFAHCTDKSEI